MFIWKSYKFIDVGIYETFFLEWPWNGHIGVEFKKWKVLNLLKTESLVRSGFKI